MEKKEKFSTTRKRVEKVFENPDRVESFLSTNPSRHPRTQYLEYNGVVLGVKNVILLSIPQSRRDSIFDFTTTSAISALRKMGFKNFLTAKELNFEFEKAEVSNAIEVHKRVETSMWTRDRKLRDAALKKSRYICEACDFEPSLFYGSAPSVCLEVHHLMPLSHVADKKQNVLLSELACLCANCHRAIHWMISNEKRVIEVQELRNSILTTR